MFHAYFIGKPIGEWEGRTVWQQLAPLPWSVWNGFIKGENPLYFQTDFASAPRHFGMYEKFGGKCNQEADGHDFLYRKDAKIYVDINKWPEVFFPLEAEKWLREIPKSSWYTNIPKELADYIFRQLMIEEDEPETIYEKMYLAVVLAGRSSYHKFKVADPLPCERFYKIVKDDNND